MGIKPPFRGVGGSILKQWVDAKSGVDAKTGVDTKSGSML
jgi:hypothetical protein